MKKPAKATQGKTDKVAILFNLRDDPGEKKDLSKEHPEIPARLKEQLDTFRAEFSAKKRPAGIAE